MSHPIPSTVRADDLLRHLQDLRLFDTCKIWNSVYRLDYPHV